MTQTIKDAKASHWVYRMPTGWIPYLQLSRMDRPIGYWLLTLPGWIGLSFSLFYSGDNIFKFAALILIGAIAMRGAGCTYNDIVDRDLDAQVERTALRPIPAGSVSVKQAWLWLLVQCLIGLMVLLCLPRLSQILALCSIPLVAAYPFMKRITWWPQVWLGLTFNWAALVAFSAATETIGIPIILIYFGLVFWTIGYDTIYACQDIEDDAFVGIKSTARRFGNRVKLGVGICYTMACLLVVSPLLLSKLCPAFAYRTESLLDELTASSVGWWVFFVSFAPFVMSLFWQVIKLDPNDSNKSLILFKRNWISGILLCLAFFVTFALTAELNYTDRPYSNGF